MGGVKLWSNAYKCAEKFCSYANLRATLFLMRQSLNLALCPLEGEGDMGARLLKAKP